MSLEPINVMKDIQLLAPKGWTIRIHADTEGMWISIMSPDGKNASFSGPKQTIMAQVLAELYDALP